MLKEFLQVVVVAFVLGVDALWLYWVYRLARHKWKSKDHSERYWWCIECWMVRWFGRRYFSY